jgi:hypothetical protein
MRLLACGFGACLLVVGLAGEVDAAWRDSSVLRLSARTTGCARACGGAIAYEAVTGIVVRSSHPDLAGRAVRVALSCTRRMSVGRCVEVVTDTPATDELLADRSVPYAHRWRLVPCSTVPGDRVPIDLPPLRPLIPPSFRE